MGFACFEFSINGILLKVIFHILHILLNLVVDCSLLWDFASLYTHSVEDGYKACFRFEGTMNNVSINLFVHMGW